MKKTIKGVNIIIKLHPIDYAHPKPHLSTAYAQPKPHLSTA